MSLFSKLRTIWYQGFGALSQRPNEFWASDHYKPNSVHSADQALSLSPIYAALRWYQTTLSSLPLITYRDLPGNAREEATTHSAYKILKDKPNPAMTRNTFMQVLARELFFSGEFFAQIRWRTNGSLLGIYPIAKSDIRKVIVDEDWHKAYVVNMQEGEEILQDSEVLHIIAIPDDYGIRGISFIQYAAESLGLHKQVLDSANNYYQNAVKPSGYYKFPGKIADRDKLIDYLEKRHAGTANTGKPMVLTDAGEWQPFSNMNAEDARIIEALNTSVADSSRWTGIAPMILGDYSGAHYGSLAAENEAVFQKSLRWLLEAVEQEYNNKLFNDGFFAEFDTTGILRGDPVAQSQVDQTYVQMGAKTRAEVRADSLNLPPIAGLEEPLAPVNQAPAASPGAPEATPGAPGATPAASPAVSEATPGAA